MTRGDAAVLGLVMAGALALGLWPREPQAPGTPAEVALLRQLAAQEPLQMISSTSCGHCTRARRWLAAEGVRFEECFIETDARCAARFAAAGAAGTPTFVVRERAAVLGLDVARLVALLGVREAR